MNYISEINKFYDLLETNPLSGNAVNLWHALMATANKARWAEWFTVAISLLETKTGLNKKAVERARNELRQKGFIDWDKRGGNQSAKYNIISLCDNNDIDFVPQTVPQTVPQMSHKLSPLINKTKTKPNNTEKEKNKKENFQIPTISEIQTYCAQRSNGIDPQRFFDFYQSKGWMVGRNPMKDWKAAVRTWEGKSKEEQPKQPISERKVIYEAAGIRKTATEKIYNADVKLYGDSIKFIQYC